MVQWLAFIFGLQLNHDWIYYTIFLIFVKWEELDGKSTSMVYIFFGIAQTPAQACKLYVYLGRRDPVVIRPRNGMSEKDFRQINGPLIFETDEIVAGSTGVIGELLRLDFRVIPYAVWVPVNEST